MNNEQYFDETKQTTSEAREFRNYKDIQNEKYNTISSFSHPKIKNKKKQFKLLFDSFNSLKGKKRKNNYRYLPESLS